MQTSERDVQGTIAQLWIYPVKSCAGISVPRARLSAHGLQWDRHWMVVDAAGEFLTQRSHPRMVLIQPQITDAHLILHFPGLEPLQLPLTAQGGQRKVRVWKDRVDAWDLGDSAAAAAQWLTAALGSDCALVRFDEQHPRQGSERWVGSDAAPVHFADGYPLLVLSQSAVDELNQRLLAAGAEPVDARRFRPNVLIEGIAAHDEDRTELLELLEMPGISLRPCKPCTRCPIPDIDPETAQSQPSVTQAISAYRQDSRVEGAITFGMNALVLGLPEAQAQSVELVLGQTLAGDLAFD